MSEKALLRITIVAGSNLRRALPLVRERFRERHRRSNIDANDSREMCFRNACSCASPQVELDQIHDLL